MAAPKGNKYWELAKNIGRNKVFETPQELLEGCTAYFKWVEENPLFSIEAFAYKGEVEKEPMPKMRAMSIQALCNHLGIVVTTWKEYEKREEFKPICKAAKQIMFSQKFEGASAGLLNHAIIARELGLADKQELKADFQRPILEGGKHLPGDAEGLTDQELLGD